MDLNVMEGSIDLSGTWLPARPPRNSAFLSGLLIASSIVGSTTYGYDGSMLNGLNILPSYTTYFNLNRATLGLQSSSSFIGSALAGLCWGKVTDLTGRRRGLFWASVLTMFAAALQAASQNAAMFVFARILIGFGAGASGISAAIFLDETLPLHLKAQGLGLYNDCYYAGALIAAGVTYGSARLSSTWVWRLPSMIQGLFSVLCVFLLFFVPESPQWLATQGKEKQAFAVIAYTHADGDISSTIAITKFAEMRETTDYEKSVSHGRSVGTLFKSPSARKRSLMAVSVGLFGATMGAGIPSYYLGTILSDVGLKSVDKQLQVNIVLNVWCFICSLAGTWCLARHGRKSTALGGTFIVTVLLFVIGALMKVYYHSTNTSAIYGTITVVFVFSGAYAFVWIPLYYMLPPELLYFQIKGHGMGMLQFVSNVAGLIVGFILPVELARIGWKTYLTQGIWDAMITIAIWYWWIETKDKTSEEIDNALLGTRSLVDAENDSISLRPGTYNERRRDAISRPTGKMQELKLSLEDGSPGHASKNE